MIAGRGTISGVNLVPGTGIREQLGSSYLWLGLLNVIGNLVMFIPVGFLVPLAARVRWRTAVAACAALSVAIEAAQLTTGRSADIDDVLLNTLGGAAGAAVAFALLQVVRRGADQHAVRR